MSGLSGNRPPSINTGLSSMASGWNSSNSSCPMAPISPTNGAQRSPSMSHDSPHPPYHSNSYTSLSSPSSPTSAIPHSPSQQMGSMKGKLQKKGMWTGWTDAYYCVTEGGMLFEFKHEQSTKPIKVLQLTQCTVQLAENLTGKPFSFVIACPKTEDLFLRASDEVNLINWVSSIGTHCTSAPVQWGTDSFLEAFVDAVVISSEDGIILGVNQRTCDMFGYEKHEMMGRSVELLTPPAIAAAHAQYMKSYIQTGQKRLLGKPRNVPMRHKNGDIFRSILSLGEKKEEDGSIRFIATMRSEISISHEKIKETITSSMDLNLDNFAKSLKDAVLGQVSDVFDTIEQLRVKNKQLSAQLAILEKQQPAVNTGADGNIQQIALNLDNIIIHEKLAATGGSGASVFSCSVDGFRCAMKELHVADSTDGDIDSFSAEILLLEKIPYHKNIVRYLFHTRTETSIRLFMTQYAGTLSKLVSKKASEGLSYFGRNEVIRFFLELVNGIEVLQNLKILHRDIKSDNIFYSLGPDGNVSHLCIGDLDTAKVVSINKNTNTVVGTPGYMAPEVLLGSTYSHEVDIWSIGMIVYELMTLQRPYSNASIFQVAQLVINGELPPISSTLKAKYQDIIPLWEQCVKKDPRERPTVEKIKEYLAPLMKK